MNIRFMLSSIQFKMEYCCDTNYSLISINRKILKRSFYCEASVTRRMVLDKSYPVKNQIITFNIFMMRGEQMLVRKRSNAITIDVN